MALCSPVPLLKRCLWEGRRSHNVLQTRRCRHGHGGVDGRSPVCGWLRCRSLVSRSQDRPARGRKKSEIVVSDFALGEVSVGEGSEVCFSDHGRCAGAWVHKRLRQIPDEGLNRLPRLLTVSADGESLRKSAIALASSPSLMGETGVRNVPIPKPRTISS